MPTMDNVFQGKDERTFIFIDGPNNHSAARALGHQVDFKKLLVAVCARARLIRAYYYTTIPNTDEYKSIKPLIDWLDYNGYQVVTKPSKELETADGRRRFKSNLDIELTVGALQHAIKGHMDHMLLFSGNGDYRPLVEAVQMAGVRVTVISALQTSPPVVADELRRTADFFLDLEDMDIFRP